jgi:hypothetical protein
MDLSKVCDPSMLGLGSSPTLDRYSSSKLSSMSSFHTVLYPPQMERTSRATSCRPCLSLTLQYLTLKLNPTSHLNPAMNSRLQTLRRTTGQAAPQGLHVHVHVHGMHACMLATRPARSALCFLRFLATPRGAFLHCSTVALGRVRLQAR